jgi:tetratricopeptide (TPR) repeat protein
MFPQWGVLSEHKTEETWMTVTTRTFAESELEDVLRFFASLPPEHERKYETEISRLVEHGGPHLAEVLCAILEQDAGLSVYENREDLRFAAYVALATHARRMKDSFFHRQVLNRYKGEFTGHILFDHIESLLLKTERRYIESLELAERAVAQLPDHTGVLHNFAEAVVLVRENQLPIDDDTLARARKCIRRAIQLSPDYAKFYCTQGRLEALDGHFDKAIELINKAIDEESSDKKDYSIRLADYQAYLTNVYLQKASHNLEQQVAAAHRQIAEARAEFQEVRDKLSQSIDELKKENLQILGFFAAVLSLTIGSIQLLSKESFQDATLLIITLGGTLLTVYTGFILAIGGMPNRRRHLFSIMILGIAMIVGSDLAHHFFAG